MAGTCSTVVSWVSVCPTSTTTSDSVVAEELASNVVKLEGQDLVGADCARNGDDQAFISRGMTLTVAERAPAGSWAEVTAVLVLRPAGIVDTVVERSAHRQRLHHSVLSFVNDNQFDLYGSRAYRHSR
jgi:hypothetical protein